jgi:hypothetical protein
MMYNDKIKSEYSYVKQPLPNTDNTFITPISAKTIDFPYRKHLNAFVEKLNKLAGNQRQVVDHAQ